MKRLAILCLLAMIFITYSGCVNQSPENLVSITPDQTTVKTLVNTPVPTPAGIIPGSHEEVEKWQNITESARKSCFCIFSSNSTGVKIRKKVVICDLDGGWEVKYNNQIPNDRRALTSDPEYTLIVVHPVFYQKVGYYYSPQAGRDTRDVNSARLNFEVINMPEQSCFGCFYIYQNPESYDGVTKVLIDMIQASELHTQLSNQLKR